MQRSEHPVRPSAHRPRNAEFWILLPLERRSRPNWTLSSDGNIFPCVPRRSAALLVALVRVFDFGKYLIAFRYLCRGICEWMPLLPQRADWPIPNTQYPMPNTQCSRRPRRVDSQRTRRRCLCLGQESQIENGESRIESLGQANTSAFGMVWISTGWPETLATGVVGIVRSYN